jgi:hypothetical protein
MELPYQPISDAEAQELAVDLADVALSQGDRALYTRIKDSLGGSSSSSSKGPAAAGRMSDIQALPDG